MEQILAGVNTYLLDPESLWVVVGYMLSSIISSVAIYDFGPFKPSKHLKRRTIFLHYTILALFFALTAFITQSTETGISLATLSGFLLLMIKLFIAYFLSMILYKIVKDFILPYLTEFLTSKFSTWFGKK